MAGIPVKVEIIAHKLPQTLRSTPQRMSLGAQLGQRIKFDSIENSRAQMLFHAEISKFENAKPLDVYKLGAVFYKELTGKPEMPGLYESIKLKNNIFLIDRIGKREWCWSMLEKMLRPDEKARGTAEEVRDDVYSAFMRKKRGTFGEPLIDIKGAGARDERKLGEGTFGAAYKMTYGIGRGEVNIVRKKIKIRAGYECDNMPSEYSPFVVRSYGEGREDVGGGFSVPYIDMEHVEGRSLSRFIARNEEDREKIQAKEVIDIICQAAYGLADLHSAGIAHRDIKPDNIMLRDDGRAKILDLGISANLSKGETEKPFFSPLWAPLEQHGGKVDPRHDLFSLGLTMASLLAGRLLIGRDGESTLADQMRSLPRKIDGIVIVGLSREIEEKLRSLLKKSLATDPGRRYQSADELTTDLETLLAP